MKKFSIALCIAALTLFAAFSLSSCSSFQNSNSPLSPSASPTPTTKLEAFQGKAGRVLIKNYSEMGAISGSGGAVGVSAIELVDPTTKTKEYGLLVTTTGSNQY